MKQKIIILCIIIVIPLIIIASVLMSRDDVYTKKHNKDSSLPQVNSSSNDVDAINDLLENLYNKYTKEGSKFNYKKFENNDVISLLVIIDEYRSDRYVKKYLSYNIDKKTNKFLTNEELLKLYNSDLEQVKEKVNKRLNVYYTEEGQEGYFEKNECDYECYLSYMRGIDILVDNISLIVEDNKLVAYINLNIDSFSDDEEYFESLNYDPYKVVIE